MSSRCFALDPDQTNGTTNEDYDANPHKSLAPMAQERDKASIVRVP